VVSQISGDTKVIFPSEEQIVIYFSAENLLGGLTVTDFFIHVDRLSDRRGLIRKLSIGGLGKPSTVKFTCDIWTEAVIARD